MSSTKPHTSATPPTKESSQGADSTHSHALESAIAGCLSEAKASVRIRLEAFHELREKTIEALKSTAIAAHRVCDNYQKSRKSLKKAKKHLRLKLTFSFRRQGDIDWLAQWTATSTTFPMFDPTIREWVVNKDIVDLDRSRHTGRIRRSRLNYYLRADARVVLLTEDTLGSLRADSDALLSLLRTLDVIICALKKEVRFSGPLSEFALPPPEDSTNRGVNDVDTMQDTLDFVSMPSASASLH